MIVNYVNISFIGLDQRHINDDGFSQGSLLRERLSTVDLLVLTSLDQLLFILQILFTLVTQQTILMRRSTVQSLPSRLVFPGLA
jgi:hypothetical protein